MQRTRRGLLGVGAAAVTGLSGCLGVQGVEYPDAAAPDPPAVDDGGDGGEGSDDDPGETVDDGDADRVPNEALATATRNVVDDVVWFASEYPSAVETYQQAVQTVITEIDAVSEAADAGDAVRVEMADRLEAVGLAAADTAADALGPHFHPRSRLASRTERHVEKLRTFAPRGDVDRFLEELSRMRRGFAGMATGLYVDAAFSRDPIHNRLLNRLLYPLPRDTEEREETLDDAFVELALANRGFATVAREPYDTDEYDRARIPKVYGSAFDGARRRELRARLGPIPRSADRTEELFVAFATRPEAGNRPSETFTGWAHELDGVTLYVQRYPNARIASERLEAALGDAATEGRAPIDPDATAAGSDFSGNATTGGDGEGADDASRSESSQGPTRWHRVYHEEADGERYGYDDHAGVQYGYAVQAGEFVLATGFSGDAWEERAGWQGPLADGWVVV